MFSGPLAGFNPKCDCKCDSKNMPVAQATRGDGSGGKIVGAVLICQSCKHQIWLG